MYKKLFVLSLAVAVGFSVSDDGLPLPAKRTLEFQMATRDGVGLHTLIYFPRDMEEGVTEGKKYTAIVDRSPYGYSDMEWITDLFLPFGFVAVGQDMRGTEKSGGNFSMWQMDKLDSEDLGNWIALQSWSNGKVMSLGASADGIASLQMIANPDPHYELAAQYIMWAPSAMYDILFPHGCYKQETTEDWLHGLEMPNPEVVDDNIQTVYDNEAHTEYWKEIETSPEKLSHVKFPSAFASGWYDLFVVGNIAAYDQYNAQSDPSVVGASKLTIDALGHCMDGAGFFTESLIAGEGRTALILAQMFEVYGIRPVSRNQIKNITFYVMSGNDEAGKAAGQWWTSMENFPEFKAMDFFLQPDKSAMLTKPMSGDKATSYVVDPAKPILTVGGNNLPPDIGGSIHCGPEDQQEQDKRDDVVVFQTEVFDHDFAMTGPLWANLFVSSDAVDTDFMVKISDLYPTGEAILIQDSGFRMRWRENGLEPVYMKKDEVYEINVNLWNTSWVVATGHALRFSISSSNNPRFSVNPQNGLLLKDPAYPGVNITATNTIHHSAAYPSKITLPHVELSQLPKVHVLKEVQAAYPSITEEVIAKSTKGLNSRMKLARAKP